MSKWLCWKSKEVSLRVRPLRLPLSEAMRLNWERGSPCFPNTLWEQIPKWAEKGSNQFVYKLLVGVGNGSPALHRHLSYDPCNSNVRYSPRAMKAYVHTFTTNSSFICNSQKLEITQMSTDECITKSAGCNTTQQQEKQIIDYSGCGHVDASYLILS